MDADAEIIIMAIIINIYRITRGFASLQNKGEL
jgi:hypothetical protein